MANRKLLFSDFLNESKKTAYENQYNCPICLESLLEPQKLEKGNNSGKKPSKSGDTDQSDSTTHVISILCGHFFHISCLEQWYT